MGDDACGEVRCTFTNESTDFDFTMTRCLWDEEGEGGRNVEVDDNGPDAGRGGGGETDRAVVKESSDACESAVSGASLRRES